VGHPTHRRTGAHVTPTTIVTAPRRRSAVEIRSPTSFYGERGGRLRDPYGQQWMLSQRIEDLTHEEIARRAALLSGSTS
jgi:hypothetical protein